MKITIPDNWSEVTLRQFIELNQIESENEIMRGVEIISILSDIDPEEIKKIEAEDLKKILDNLKWINELPSSQEKFTITVKEEDYHLIPLQKLTLGQWIDLESWVKNHTDNLGNIMALLYRKTDEKYNSSLMSSKAEMFLDELKVDDIYGTMLFFCLIVQEFIKNTPNFLLETTLETMKT